MPIPKPEKSDKTKGVPKRAKHGKKDYASITRRAAERRKYRALKRAERLARLRAKRLRYGRGLLPPTEQRRLDRRLVKFGARPNQQSPIAVAGA
jgi:hypothetical protein